MSDRFPATDRAGTLAWVRRAANQPPVNLHFFWDRAADLPGPDIASAETIARAAEAMVSPDKVAPSEGTVEGQFHAWTMESEDLAAKVAYQGVALTASARPEDAPVLPPAYLGESRRLAEQRLGQAGIRLERLLTGLFP